MKYSFDLKESLPRKLLRYALWAIILLGGVALVMSGGHMVKRSILSANMGDPAGALTILSPEKALTLGEKLYNFSPSEKTKLKLVHVGINTENWKLADILLDGLRPCKTFAGQVLNALVTAQTAPEALPTALAEIRTVPQDDEERLLLLQLSSIAGDDNISNLARRNARSIETAPDHNRAAIYLARMAMNEGRPQESREMIAKLMGQRLSAADAVSLLQICETLQISEANDYRSTLKLAAHSDAPLALCLTKYFLKSDPPAKVLAWLQSLPQDITATAEINAEIVALQGTPNEQAEKIFALATAPKELALAAHLARETQNYKEELTLLQKLNDAQAALWSQVAAAEAARKSQNMEALRRTYGALDKSLPGNFLIQTQLAYLDLLGAEPKTKDDYDLLKSAAARYPERNEIKSYLAFAHYRLGNLTDGLLLLPKEPSTQRQKLLSALLLSSAGQNDRAEAFLKDISPEVLLPEESDLHQATLKKLQESAPLREWINILKKN